MKKFLIVCCITFLVLALLVVGLWVTLPSIGTYLLGRAVHGSVQISRFERGYDNGALFFHLSDVTLKGSVEGTIRDWRLQVKPWKGLYLSYVGISDFELTIKDAGGNVEIIPVPVELAELKRGSVTYKGQKFIVREIKVRNFNTGGTPEFELDGGVEGLGNLKTKGSGFFRDKRSDIQGELFYSRLDLSKMLKGYEGFLSGSGNFAFKDERLTCVISVEAVDFVMREKFLNKPLRIARETARAVVVVALEGLKTDVHLQDLVFKEVPVDLKWTLEGKELATLQLRTGFLAVPDVKEYIDLEPLAKRGSEILDLLTDGAIMVKQLNFTEPSPFLAELELRDVSASYGTTDVREIDAVVKLTDDSILVSNAKGSYERSRFYDVSGTIPFAPQKEIEGKGRFSFDLRDISALLGREDVQLTGGTTDGQAEVKGKEETGLALAGAGTVRDAEIVWRRLTVKASGSYRFHDQEVVFDPLTVYQENSRLTVKGSVQKDVMHLDFDGNVGAAQIKALGEIPYPIDGTAAVEGLLIKDHESISARGIVSLRGLSIEVPGLLKKEKEVESSVTIDVRWDNKLLRIDRLTCTLADASLEASGGITKESVVDAKLTLDVPRLDTISKLLFIVGSIEAEGTLKLSAAVSDLRLPIRTVPLVDGELRFSNGGFKLPFFVKPLTDIALTAEFKGNQFFVDLASLRIGKTSVRRGALFLDRQSSPRFSVMIDLEALEPNDFAGPEKRKFRIPVIDKDSLMATLNGDVKIRWDRMTPEGLGASNVEMSGTFKERCLNVDRLTANVFGGSLSAAGKVDLSGPLPVLQVSGAARDVKGGTLIRLFDPESEVLQATGVVTASLSSTGRDSEELIRGLGGGVSAESHNGVIRKWNLLSKIFGLLNVYDFFRGKVRWSETGLPYTKSGVTLQGENGIFKTGDFLIDSPSMVIAGQGTINLPDETLDGKLVVSPLVALDRTIDFIPILRSIFKRKEGGFAYVVYDVKGPFRDPELSTSYTQSIGKRPLDLLKNILLLPKGVFEK